MAKATQTVKKAMAKKFDSYQAKNVKVVKKNPNCGVRGCQVCK